MRQRILAAPTLVFAFAAGTGRAQPPTAPPPRAVESPPAIDHRSFKYIIRTAAAAVPPNLDIVAGKRTEVRWTEGGTTYTLTAPQVAVRGGVISATGTPAGLAELRITSSRGTETDRNVVAGRRIVADTTKGTFTVESAGGSAAPRDR